jgi:serine/threonine-protein kinase HipA
VISACGLLDADFRTPALDYSDLVRATLALTRDAREVEKLYRIAVFNVLAHNRDDHSKNISFLMDATGRWRLAPAYDLTFSSGPGGQHSTLVMGEGLAPGRDHLIALAKTAGLAERHAMHIIDRTRAALSQWRRLTADYGISAHTVALVAARTSR